MQPVEQQQQQQQQQERMEGTAALELAAEASMQVPDAPEEGVVSSAAEAMHATQQQLPLPDILSISEAGPTLERESSVSRHTKKAFSAKFKEGLPTLLAPESSLGVLAEGIEDSAPHRVTEPGNSGVERSRRREREREQAAQAAQSRSQSKSGSGSAAVPNCRSLFNKVHGHPRLGVAKLTQHVWSRSVWEVLKGGCHQQRVWSMGNPFQGCGAESDAGPVGRHTSQHPLALIEGINITCVSAGHSHGAAVAAGSTDVYTWGTVVAGTPHNTSNTHATAATATATATASASASNPSCPSPAPQHEACPWQPFNAEPVSCLMVPELVPRPQTPGLHELLAKLPDSLRHGLKNAGLHMEHQDAMDMTRSEVRLWRVSMPAPVLLVACGAHHTLAALATGGVVAWGRNNRGQVGVPADGNEVLDDPSQVPGLLDVTVVALAGGGAHSAAVAEDGSVWTWGDNSEGQLGLGFTSSQPHLPSVIKLPLQPGVAVRSLACGSSHTLALTSDGQVYSWGSNSCGQLGRPCPLVQSSVATDDEAGDHMAAAQPPPALCDGTPALVHDLPPCRLLAASAISAAVTTIGRLFLWGTDTALNPNVPMEPLEPPTPALRKFEFELEMPTPFKLGSAEAEGEAAEAVATLAIAADAASGAVGAGSGASGDGVAGSGQATPMASPAKALAAPGAAEAIVDEASNPARQRSVRIADQSVAACSSVPELVTVPTIEALASFEASMAHLSSAPSATMLMFGMESPAAGKAGTAMDAPGAVGARPPAQSAVPQPWRLQQVAWLRPQRVRLLALGPMHGIVTTEDGSVYAWGALEQGLGMPLTSATVPLWASDEEVVAATATLGPGKESSGAWAVGGQKASGGERLLGASLQQLGAQEGCGAVQLYSPPTLEGLGGTQRLQQSVQVPLLRELWLRQQREQEQERQRQPASRSKQRRQVTPPNASGLLTSSSLQLRVSFHYFNDTVALTIIEAEAFMVAGADAGAAIGAVAGAGAGARGAGAPGSLTNTATRTAVVDKAGVAAAQRDQAKAARQEAGAREAPPSPPSSPTPWDTDQPVAAQDEELDFDSFADSCLQLPLGQEPVCLLSAGVGHTLLLCASSTYQARPSALRRLALLLLSQMAWQYNVQRQAVDNNTAATAATGAGAGASAGVSGASGATVMAGGGLATESSTVSVWGDNTAAATAATATTAATVPASLLALPDAAQAGMPWGGVLLGQQLCTLLCRQVGLVDNLTEYLDVVSAHAKRLAAKRGRLPPSVLQAQQQQNSQQQQQLDGTGPVLRPSMSGAPTARSQSTQVPSDAAGAASLTSTAQQQQQQQQQGARQLEQPAVMEQAGLGLTVEELLDMMLDLMADRHPELTATGVTDDTMVALLRLLCGRHLPLLQLRAPHGVPWVLSRIISPRFLQQLDSGSLSEAMHRAYVYMTSAQGTADDLHMGLKDMKMGLRNQEQMPSQRPKWQQQQAVVQHASATVTAVGKDGKDDKAAGSKGKGAGSKNSLQLFLLAAGIESPRVQYGRPARTSKLGNASTGGAAAGPPPGSEAMAAAMATAAAAPFSVPLLRAAQFLRQAGLVPKVLLQYISELYDEHVAHLRKVPYHELTPWWWTRDRTLRPFANLPPGVGTFRTCPEIVDLLQQAVLTGLMVEYEVMGVALARTRKRHDRAMASEAFKESVEPRRRDRLLAYVLAHLLGSYLAPVLVPDQQKPTHVLAMPVSYPQFVEMVGTCLVLRMATQSETGMFRELRAVWPTPLITSTMHFAMDCFAMWRERVLSPWRFNKIIYSDVELDNEVDNIFSLFATIDPLKNTVLMTPVNYQLMLEACSIYDESLTHAHANLVFFRSAKMPSEQIYDFVAYSKELDRRGHQMRLQAAILDKRAQSEAAAAAAVAAAGGDAGGEGQQALGTAEPGDAGAATAGQEAEGMGQASPSPAPQAQLVRGGVNSSKIRRFSAPGAGSMSVGQRRRQSMNGGDDGDDEIEVDAPLPEGWPSPIPADVQLLAALDLPSLTVAKTKPGEMTYMQRQQLQAELAEVPADDDWSGLTRRQLTRLNNAPLALSLARQELQEGIREPGAPDAPGPAPALRGGFSAAAATGVDAMVGAGGLPPMRMALSPIKSMGGASGRRSGTPTWASDNEGPASGRLSRTSSSPNRGVLRSSSQYKRDMHLVPSGPQAVTAEQAPSLGSSPGMVVPHAAVVKESAQAAVTLLASLDDPRLVSAFRAPPSSAGLTRVRTPEQVHAMRQARRGSIDASKTDDEITPPPSRQADEARPGSPLRLSSISFSGRARDQQDPGMVPVQQVPHDTPFAQAPLQAGMPGQAPGEGPKGASRGGSRGGARGQSSRLGSPLRTQSPQIADGEEWGPRNIPSREGPRYEPGAPTSSGFDALQAPPSRDSARGGSRRGSRTATPPAPVTAWDGAWTLPAASNLRQRSSLDPPSWQLLPLDVPPPVSYGHTPPLGAAPSSSAFTALGLEGKPHLPAHLPPLLSPSKVPRTSATAASATSSPQPGSNRHRSPNVLGISQPTDVANASLAAIRAGASLSHLTTTRAHVQLGMRGLEEMDPSALDGATLDRKQFGEAVRQLSVMKYSKISSPIAAWRMMVDRHILPVANMRNTRFDAYLVAVMGPGVIATVLAWEPHLKKLYAAYSKPEVRNIGPVAGAAGAGAGGKAQGSKKDQGTQGHQAADRQEVLLVEERVPLVSFLKLLQDRHILPKMVRPTDLEEVFRRVLFFSGAHTTTIEPLTYPQFTDVAAMTAMALYDQKKYKGLYHTLEAKLEAFFCMLCGIPPPQPIPLTADAQQLIYGRIQTDPYKLWWDLAALFKPEDEVKALDFMSSQHYHPALIQDVIIHPEPCPFHVVKTLAEAVSFHNSGRFDAAIDTFAQAREQWQADTRPDGPLGTYAQLGLLANQRLYFNLVIGSVLMSAGRYEDALGQYEEAEVEADMLPEGHPNLGLLFSCRAVTLHAMGRTQLAYEQAVKAMVIRSQAPELGPKHVDTQLACHNLGCILDRLGCTHRALELLQAAHEVFQHALGSRHPRTQTARRNLRHAQHKCVELEMHYKIQKDRPKPGAKAEVGQGHHVPASRRRRQAVARSAPLGGHRPGSPGDGPLPQQGRDAVIGLRQAHLTLQQRLDAFRERNTGPDRPCAPHGRCDLLYLGAGMHVASADTLAVYETVKEDLALRAAGVVVPGLRPEVLAAIDAHAAQSHPTTSHAGDSGGVASDGGTHSTLPKIVMRSGVADKTLTARVGNKKVMHSPYHRKGTGGGAHLPPVSKSAELSVHERLLDGTSAARKVREPKVIYVDRLAELLSPKLPAKHEEKERR